MGTGESQGRGGGANIMVSWKPELLLNFWCGRGGLAELIIMAAERMGGTRNGFGFWPFTLPAFSCTHSEVRGLFLSFEFFLVSRFGRKAYVGIGKSNAHSKFKFKLHVYGAKIRGNEFV
jgi:hypothetical protein